MAGIIAGNGHFELAPLAALSLPSSVGPDPHAE